MRLGLPFAALLGSCLAWIAPPRWTWTWEHTEFPPAVQTAPDFAVLGADTLRFEASASRDYFPRVVGPCGAGADPDAHDLRMALVIRPARLGLTPPALDSVWLVHRTGTLVDEPPSWSNPGDMFMILFRVMPEWAVGDSFTVLVAARGLPGGQRYMAVPVLISMSM